MRARSATLAGASFTNRHDLANVGTHTSDTHTAAQTCLIKKMHIASYGSNSARAGAGASYKGLPRVKRHVQNGFFAKLNTTYDAHVSLFASGTIVILARTCPFTGAILFLLRSERSSQQSSRCFEIGSDAPSQTRKFLMPNPAPKTPQISGTVQSVAQFSPDQCSQTPFMAQQSWMCAKTCVIPCAATRSRAWVSTAALWWLPGRTYLVPNVSVGPRIADVDGKADPQRPPRFLPTRDQSLTEDAKRSGWDPTEQLFGRTKLVPELKAHPLRSCKTTWASGRVAFPIWTLSHPRASVT